MLDYDTIQWKGILEDKFYTDLVKKLKFEPHIENRVLVSKPNLYLLQEIYLSQNKEKLIDHWLHNSQKLSDK
jgi:hypothetical protein